MDNVKIALLNMPIEAGDVAVNIEKLKQLAKEAAEQGAKMVFAPELTLIGYAVRDFADKAETPESRIISDLSRFASSLDIALGYGLVLKKEEKLFNCYLITSEGKNHFFGKTHKWWYGDRDFSPWESLDVVEIRGIPTGVMVCFDGRFPEVSRILALKEAQLIVWPCNWPLPPKSDPRYLQIIGRARAFENLCYLAMINRTGTSEREKTSYAGDSSFFDPTGLPLAKAGTEEEIVFCEFEGTKLEQIRGKFDIYTERKPEFYESIATQKAPNWYYSRTDQS